MGSEMCIRDRSWISISRMASSPSCSGREPGGPRTADIDTCQAPIVCILVRRTCKGPFRGMGARMGRRLLVAATQRRPEDGSSLARPHIYTRREVSIMRIQHWQDAGSLLVGVWLVLSSFVLGLSGAAVWITIALGLGVMLFAVEAFVIPSYLEEWGDCLLYTSDAADE